MNDDDTSPSLESPTVLYLTPADRQQSAREAYRDHMAAGTQLTGAALGNLFDRSGRWGNDRIAEVLRDHDLRAGGDEPVPTSGDAAATSAVDSAVSPAAQRITTVAVLAVAAVAAIASYDHQRQLAALAGEGWRAWLLPVSVDGLIVAASMTLLVRRRTNQRAGILPWTALLLGGTASVVANIAAADPTLAGRLVAAWPPVALLVSYELFLIANHHPALSSRSSSAD